MGQRPASPLIVAVTYGSEPLPASFAVSLIARTMYARTTTSVFVDSAFARGVGSDARFPPSRLETPTHTFSFPADLDSPVEGLTDCRSRLSKISMSG